MEQFRPENLSSTTKVQKNQRVVAMGATRLSIARRPLNLRLSFSVGSKDAGQQQRACLAAAAAVSSLLKRPACTTADHSNEEARLVARYQVSMFEQQHGSSQYYTEVCWVGGETSSFQMAYNQMTESVRSLSARVLSGWIVSRNFAWTGPD
mmetsp:Transcript_42456/g.165757  ORF Transcript_42456/g.165757 Transcript_42456/m.165757 type:complete len:151 (+) Transcript_42456:2932-3384(+)